MHDFPSILKKRHTINAILYICIKKPHISANPTCLEKLHRSKHDDQIYISNYLRMTQLLLTTDSTLQ